MRCVSPPNATMSDTTAMSAGPLHGIPVLLKDNIATNDRMETTAGSFALVGSQVPRDAVLVSRLRRAGAVILGKANLSEWANFRGFIPSGFPNGWSGRGGFTRNPYVLDWDPCGSSSGSAVAAAANLASLTVGTETDGSIVCPSGNNGIVGLKPTRGLVSQNGIIPIGHSQDTAGPMTRTVTDAATMLNALKSPFGPVKGHKLPRDYRKSLKRGALKGARIGVDRLEFQEAYFAIPELNVVTEQALDVMHDAGATIIDIDPSDCPDPNVWFEPEFAVLLNEFKHDVAAYMKPLKHTKVRTLADLIEFNIDHCADEMRYFGQELFEAAEATSGDLTDPDYLAARDAERETRGGAGARPSPRQVRPRLSRRADVLVGLFGCRRGGISRDGRPSRCRSRRTARDRDHVGSLPRRAEAAGSGLRLGAGAREAGGPEVPRVGAWAVPGCGHLRGVADGCCCRRSGSLVGEVDVAGVSSAPLRSSSAGTSRCSKAQRGRNQGRSASAAGPRRGATGPCCPWITETWSAKSRVTLVVRCGCGAGRVPEAAVREEPALGPSQRQHGIRRPISELVERVHAQVVDRVARLVVAGVVRARRPCRRTRRPPRLS